MGRRSGKCGENVSRPVSVKKFREMCRVAVSDGRFCHSRPYYHKKKTTPLSLSHFCVSIDGDDGNRYPFRLDHALCLCKMKDDVDYFGEKVLGAVLYRLDGDVAWTLYYTTRPDGNVPMKGRGSIDHVVPRAKGGADALVNMQMSRAGSNMRKSDAAGFSFLDKDETENALALLEDGTNRCSDAKLRGELESLLMQERASLSGFEPSCPQAA